MRDYFCCPECGSKDLQIAIETQTQTHGSNYSAAKGCLGYLMLGPLGLLCGVCGQRKTTTTTSTNYWYCSKCGNKIKDLDSYEKEIEILNKSADFVMPVFIVLGIFFAIIFFSMFAKANNAYLTVIVFGVMLFAALLTKILYKAQARKLQEEYDRIRQQMYTKFTNGQ